MPALIGLLILLAARAATLPGASEGLTYYMRPDMSRLWDVTVLNAALGQAFFSLSLGMGAMITYGSYLNRRDGIVGAAMWVVLLDTAIALLAGFIIFPAGFSLPGFDPSASGPGLIFTVLPRLFATLPGGHLFGAAFFVLLTMAALTSTISLLEVPVSHLIDGQGWTRPKAVLAVTAATAVLAVPSALANGAVGFFSSLPVLNTDFLSLMNIVWSDFALPIGGLLIALFVGYAWPNDGAVEELRAEGAWVPMPHVWRALVRYVCPVAIFLIILFTFRAMAGY
jgi:neurotransmitter:Na+ symporter, NSS family